MQLKHTLNMMTFSLLIYFSIMESGKNQSVVEPMIQTLNPSAIIRVKANLSTRSETHRIGGWHTDQEFADITGKEMTAVYYVNDNNGWTEFEDGTKVESKANRIVCFPNDTKHTGFSQTDEKIRVVININYYE